MSVDVITKFRYLEHGKPAPKNSGYSGTITTGSILGWRQYTEREESRNLHDDAKQVNDQHTQHGFFDYTSQRIGSTKTYTSSGWIETKKQEKEFREVIAQHFCDDGHLLWTPVLSLKDYMTSAEVKLFSEKEYAAVMDRILAKFFKAAGFEHNNMEWWMDHHVNTDNPHIHLSFFEKEKTKLDGFIPNKHIDTFKKLFWNEVFAQKRFLETVGKEATLSFRDKDILKHSTFKSFREKLTTCTDETFIKDLKELALKLPNTGRLQYGSSHMIPYRKEIDELVDYLLHTPEVYEKYQSFLNCVKTFDEVRSSSLHLNKDTSFVDTENKKLRKLMANTILKEIKDCNTKFADLHVKEHKPFIDDKVTNQETIHVDKNEQQCNFKIIPVAKSLIKKHENDYSYVRLPGASTLFKVETNRLLDMFQSNKLFLVKVYENDSFSLYEKGQSTNTVMLFNGEKNTIGTLQYSNVHDFYSNGEYYMDAYIDAVKSEEEWKAEQKEWNRYKKNWIQNKYDWKQSSKNIKQASFSWMNEIEHEVDKGRLEYLYGKELDI